MKTRGAGGKISSVEALPLHLSWLRSASKCQFLFLVQLLETARPLLVARRPSSGAQSSSTPPSTLPPPPLTTTQALVSVVDTIWKKRIIFQRSSLQNIPSPSRYRGTITLSRQPSWLFCRQPISHPPSTHPPHLTPFPAKREAAVTHSSPSLIFRPISCQSEN